jgi:hypothetical protein
MIASMGYFPGSTRHPLRERWSPARLEPRRQWSWQRFSFDWQPSGPGDFTLAARATDTRGAAQPIEKARNAVHMVAVTVA